jgi:hypothetical protein
MKTIIKALFEPMVIFLTTLMAYAFISGLAIGYTVGWLFG